MLFKMASASLKQHRSDHQHIKQPLRWNTSIAKTSAEGANLLLLTYLYRDTWTTFSLLWPFHTPSLTRYLTTDLIEGVYNVYYQNIGLQVPYDIYQLPKKTCPIFILKSHTENISYAISIVSSPLPKVRSTCLIIHKPWVHSVSSTPREKKGTILVMQSCKHSSHLEMFPLPSKASSTQFKFSVF